MSDLAEVGRLAIGQHEFGPTEAQSRRLLGQTADEVRADAKPMRHELGLPPLGDGRPRDPAGRFASSGGVYDINAAIRSFSLSGWEQD
jgi:hypothetical protein